MIRRLRAWAWRLAALVDGRRSDGELAEEIETHLHLHAADLEAAGVPRDEARRRARLAFGSVDAAKERYRDRRRAPLIDVTVQDVRHSVRGFRRTPAFALAVLVVLAVGIGANAAIFTFVDALLLRPLPYREPDRLVALWHVPPATSFPGQTRFSLSPANFLDWQRQQHVFEGMALMKFRPYTLTGQGEPDQLFGQGVSRGFFELLGQQPLMGRWFAAPEDTPGHGDVVVLSHRLWKGRFGGDPGILGRTIRLNGVPHTVVGVMGPSFALPDWAQLWTPLAYSPKEWAVRGEHSCTGIARLAPGVDLRTAQAELSAIARTLEAQYPEDNTGWGALVVGLKEELVRDLRPSLLVLLGAVAFVLLIACANVANLVLARTLARRREMAVRLAVGAGAGRIVRQILTETTLLALAGGVLGWAVAHGAVRLIAAFFGDRLPEAQPLEPDGRVLVFTAVVSIATGLAAGLVPALRLSRASVTEAVKDGGLRTESDPAGSRIRAALVVVEVALSLVLLAGAGLMIRSLWQLNTVDAGLDPRQVLTAWVALPEPRYPEKEQQARFFDEVLGRVRALPGVESAGLATNLPLVNGNNWPIAVVGRPPVPMSEQPQVQGNVITPGYLRALHIPVVRGRDFTDADRAGRPAVVLVSEAMARWLWPGQDPIGQRVVTAFFPEAEREVVGIVRDVKERGLTEPGTASMYLPLAQLPALTGALVIRTRTALPAALGSAVVAAVRAIDPEQPVEDIRPMEVVVSRSVSDRRFTMFLMGAFALVALGLAAVGIYSVLAYAVRRRHREIGIRLALGASARAVVRMVITDALRPTLVGIGTGLVAALAVRGAMTTLVFGVAPGDPATFLAVCGLMVAVALGASALPAWRAARVDPVVTLRDD